MNLKKKELTGIHNTAETFASEISADDVSETAEIIFNDLVFIGMLRVTHDEEITDESILEHAARIYSDSLRVGWIEGDTTFGDFLLQSLQLAKHLTGSNE